MKVKLETGAYMPGYAHEDDCGLDLKSRERKIIYPHSREFFDTGVAVEIPKSFYGKIGSRSGLMKNLGIITDGYVDCGYTGNIGVTLINTSDDPYEVNVGDKIAQLIVCPYAKVSIVLGNLDKTERGDNGFGSSGK